MISFLKSRRNRIVCGAILVIFLTALLCQTALSFLLYNYKSKVVKYLTDTLGYKITLDDISYTFVNGLHLNGVSIFYNNQEGATVYLKDVFISVQIAPILLRKIVISKVNIDEAVLVSKRASLLLKNIRIFMYKTGAVKLNSDIKFTYRLPQENYIFRSLNNRDINQDLKCTLQGSIINKDLRVTMLSLNTDKDQILGMGIIKDAMERNPYIDLIFIPSSVALKNIPFLKNNFDAYGNLWISLKVSGPLDNLKPLVVVNLDNCNFAYRSSDGEIFDIEEITGKIEYKNEYITLEDAYLKLNNIPLNIKLKTTISQEPDISFNATLRNGYLSSYNLPVEKLEAIFTGKIKKTLNGNLEIKALYKRCGLNFEMGACFDNIELDYSNPKTKYFKAEKIKFIKNDMGILQILNFNDFQSLASLDKNHLSIKDINFRGYNSILKGDVYLDFKDKPLLEMTLTGQGLDAKTLMQDLHITDKLLSGNMEIGIKFNNYEREFLKGACVVKNGSADLNPLIEAVKFPPLKDVRFDLMQLSFAVFKDEIKITDIRLSGPDIIFSGNWSISNTIDGEIALKIKSELLNESAPFRKLLQLTKIKKGYIDFRFLLGGTAKALRFMWLKGEFKEKIGQILPTRIKKSIEANLDKSVEELSSK